MSPEGIAAGAAVAGVSITVLSGMAVLIWNAGRHSQRLDVAEGKIKSLEDGAHEAGKLDTALQVLTVTVNSMKTQLSDVSHDLKNVLTGRVVPARRNSSDG